MHPHNGLHIANSAINNLLSQGQPLPLNTKVCFTLYFEKLLGMLLSDESWPAEDKLFCVQPPGQLFGKQLCHQSPCHGHQNGKPQSPREGGKRSHLSPKPLIWVFESVVNSHKFYEGCFSKVERKRKITQAKQRVQELHRLNYRGGASGAWVEGWNYFYISLKLFSDLVAFHCCQENIK